MKWEKPSYVIEQVREYIELLRPRNTALVSLKTVDPTLKAQLKTLGVAIFENFDNETVQEEFEEICSESFNVISKLLTFTTLTSNE